MQRPATCSSPLDRYGWTIVELLVTIAIITILIVLFVPAITAVRESARKIQCQNNLRQIGIALHAFSDIDREERFATGAADFLRDGCPGKIGWLSDLNRVGSLTPEGMLCPSNPARGSAFLNQMLTTNTNDAAVTADPQDVSAGFCSAFDPSDSGYLPPGNARVNLINEQMREGFNTNFTPSWFLVRGQIHPKANQKLSGVSRVGLATGPLLERRFTRGGLRQGDLAILSGTDPVSNHIPLLGDGQSGNVVLSQTLTEGLVAGSPLVELFTRGPSVYNPAGPSMALLQGSSANLLDMMAIQPERYPQPDDVVGHGGVGNNENSYQSISGDWTASIGSGAAQKLCLQDTRGWAPVHRGSCNLLMADGSVKSIRDTNGDGYLNPGFPVEPGDASYDVLNSTVGYTDGQVEMPSMQVFGGTYLHFHRD